MYEKLEYEDKYPKISHGVSGLINRQEAQYLNKVASRLGAGFYVELGTYLGRSALCIGDGIRGARVAALLFTFDTYDSSALSSRFKTKLTSEEHQAKVVATLQESGLSEIVIPCVVGKDPWLITAGVSFLFLDADHSYEATKRDWELWREFLLPEAEVAFHDSNLDSVSKVIDEIEGWEQVDTIQTIAVLKRE